MGATQESGRASRLVTFSWLWVTAPLALVIAALAIAGHLPAWPDAINWLVLGTVLLVQAARFRARRRTVTRTRETTQPSKEQRHAIRRAQVLILAVYAAPVAAGIVVGLHMNSVPWALGVILGGSALVILAVVPVGLVLSLRAERREARRASAD